MPKFNNTRSSFPHLTALLERCIYARRRQTKGMSQYVLVDRIGVSRNCIYLLECHAHLPRIETILEMMLALQFSEEERAAFLEEYAQAYYKDKAFQKERENELVGI